MNELSKLKTYLQVSIKKNGNQPLTLQHLVNIISVMEREESQKEDLEEQKARDAYNTLGDNF